jgi:hypothetical protein
MNTIIVTADINQPSNGQIKTRMLQIIFQIAVFIVMSQYQTVVVVTKPHHKASGIDLKSVQTTHFST